MSSFALKDRKSYNLVFLLATFYTALFMHLSYRTTCFGHIRPSSGSLYVIIHESLQFICKYTVLWYHLWKMLMFC